MNVMQALGWKFCVGRYRCRIYWTGFEIGTDTGGRWRQFPWAGWLVRQSWYWKS